MVNDEVIVTESAADYGILSVAGNETLIFSGSASRTFADAAADDNSAYNSRVNSQGKEGKPRVRMRSFSSGET